VCRLIGSFEKDDSRAVDENSNPRRSRDLGVKPLAFLKRIGCERCRFGGSLFFPPLLSEAQHLYVGAVSFVLL